MKQDDEKKIFFNVTKNCIERIFRHKNEPTLRRNYDTFYPPFAKKKRKF